MYVLRAPPPPSKMKCRRAILSEIGVHSGYNSFLLKQKENSGSVTATFRDIYVNNIGHIL